MCWDPPVADGTCAGIQIPYYLSTLDEARGVSTVQCADPANWDKWNSRMAYSFCWLYRWGLMQLVGSLLAAGLTPTRCLLHMPVYETGACLKPGPVDPPRRCLPDEFSHSTFTVTAKNGGWAGTPAGSSSLSRAGQGQDRGVSAGTGATCCGA